jgi:PhzF family phenazine biosynthesis protein
MRFAGHPTIGSAHAVLSAGFTPKRPGQLIQECGVGLVKLRTGGEGIHIALPTAEYRAVEKETRVAVEQAIGASLLEDPVVIDLGVAWLTGQVASGDLLRSRQPDMNRIAAAVKKAGASGINIFGLDGDTVEVRSFALHDGAVEDPVCGSGNGAVAYYLRERRGPIDYLARQGRCLGRDGHIAIAYENDAIWLGGLAVNCIDGHITA